MATETVASEQGDGEDQLNSSFEQIYENTTELNGIEEPAAAQDSEEPEEDDDDEGGRPMKTPLPPKTRLSIRDSESSNSSNSRVSSRYSYDEVSIVSGKSSYDDVSINFGKPVIVGLERSAVVEEEDDIFQSVSFSSPISDLNLESREKLILALPVAQPVPAPRKLNKNPKNDLYENVEVPISSSSSVKSDEKSGEHKVYETLRRISTAEEAKQPPDVPPRNAILKPIPASPPSSISQSENEYCVIAEDVGGGGGGGGGGGARPKQLLTASDRIKTIDIRKAVSQWYEEAEKELERDLSIDLSLLEEKGTSKKKKEHYEQIALGENTPQQQPTPTLLRDFDPCFDLLPENDSQPPANNSDSDEVEELKKEIRKENESTTSDTKAGNLYSRLPSKNRHSETSFDLPPPSSPPPPLPPSSPPPLPPGKPSCYEIVWLGSGTSLPTVKQESSSSSTSDNKPASLPPSPKSPTSVSTKLEEAVSEEEHFSTTSTASSSSESEFRRASDPRFLFLNAQRSFSTTQLLKASKLVSSVSTNIKRKMSDQVMKKPILEPADRRHSLLDGIKPGTKSHSGVLYLYSKSKKTFQSKWCILGNGNFRYFNENLSLAQPKVLIQLSAFLSLTKRPKREEEVDNNNPRYCFDLTYMQKEKYYCRTFGAHTANERETWLEKLTQSLSIKLSSYTMAQCSRLGWAYLKEGFAGKWTPTWLSLMNRSLSYTTFNDTWEVVDLKKTKDITLRRDIANLNAPKTSVPVLVIDFVDRSLYVLVNHAKECERWKSDIESTAFNNGNTLVDQQLTADDIPVIVDKCIKFVFSQGCMTEGIYRHSGLKTKIDRLLEAFRQNAWAVQIAREDFSEHDVASTLKRFMRTLDEPLLTERLRSHWMEASAIKIPEDKHQRYRELLRKLPSINYNTLRRLISHLYAISAQSEKNLMSNNNLSSIWGPTLLTVDGQEASGFAQTSGESDVCRDLIDNYPSLFDVDQEELDRERKITEVLESISQHYERGAHGHLKRSGDLRLWVYIDTKTSGNCVCVVVHPKMTALEMTRNVLTKVNREDEWETLILHEMILGGTLERPLHHSELMLDVTLKWGSWEEADRRDNYLLLKQNVLYQEAIPCAIPPLSVFGEVYFGENNKAKFKFTKQLFSMNNAKITCYREQKSRIQTELRTWPIEEISWYLGSEEKRKAPHRLNITFINKTEPVIRTKEKPFFGRTISFEYKELFVKWIAAMLVAEHPNDVKPPFCLISVGEEK